MSFKCRKEEIKGIRCTSQCNGCFYANVMEELVDSINERSNSQPNQTIPSATDNLGQCQEEQSTSN